MISMGLGLMNFGRSHMAVIAARKDANEPCLLLPRILPSIVDLVYNLHPKIHHVSISKPRINLRSHGGNKGCGGSMDRMGRANGSGRRATVKWTRDTKNYGSIGKTSLIRQRTNE